MGSGKSSALIRHIRENRMYRADTNKRFIVFVSSIKERDERFLQKLEAKQPPAEPYCKSILALIARGDNIVTTQSLYNIFNEETIEAFHKSNYIYTAYFDEIPPLFQGASGGKYQQKDAGVITRFGSKDVQLMQQEHLILQENGEIHYNPDCEYHQHMPEHKVECNVFDALRELDSRCNLYPYGNRRGFFTGIVAFTRRELFSCFRECWFSSYLTGDSMLTNYCVKNHIDRVYYHIEDGRIVRNPDGAYMETYPEGLERLVILDDSRFNMENSLSKEGYRKLARSRDSEELKHLLKGMRYAYEFMKEHGVRSNSFIFTTFKDYKELLASDGRHYPTMKRFLPCNAKATNEYRNCTGVAYLCNRYFDVNCTNYLARLAEEEQNPELRFNNDTFALSELLQFIWRSNVRVKDSDQPAYVYIPDRRMRELLYAFMEKAKVNASVK
jgi:hypothetical protein